MDGIEVMESVKLSKPNFEEKKFKSFPDATFLECSKDGVAPENFHAMSIYPEYFKVNGEWIHSKYSRMDCAAVLRNNEIETVEFRRLKKGDFVAVGRTEDGTEGIYMHAGDFLNKKSEDVFAFRNIRSRETAFSKDYDELEEILKYEKEHGKIIWVLGPAFSFDASSRSAMQTLIENGFVHGIMAGNALATHDLEAAMFGTALGQNIYSQKNMPNGHYNHLTLINTVRKYGNIPEFIKKEDISDGIIYSCEKNNVPYVLCSSIRDDGPLPGVIANTYEGQDAMRKMLTGATTVIAMATMLHSIATGNMTPSYTTCEDGTLRKVFFYCVDSSEFAVNKLTNRGSLCSKGIVTNVQDFITILVHKLL